MVEGFDRQGSARVLGASVETMGVVGELIRLIVSISSHRSLTPAKLDVF